MKLNKLFFYGILFGATTFSECHAQCNTNTSICASNAGPFNFSAPGSSVSTCLDFWGPDYGYILLYISQSGPLELLINGDASSGYLDVAIFNIPAGEDPCVAIENNSNQISCNYASASSGCNQTGTYFPCPSSVSAPMVNAGDRLIILVENWSGLSTNFTLEMAPSPAAASSIANATINPPSLQLTNLSSSYQMTAADNGGVWSGAGITSSGLFDPSITGVGSFNITYNIGVGSCASSDTYVLTVAEGCTEPETPTLSVLSSDVCEGENTSINIIGNLNDANQWHVYSGSCGGTPIGSTSLDSIIISAYTTTTYYIRGEDSTGCVDESTLVCASFTLNVNNSSTTSDVITACDSYLWIDGNTYTQSNNTATYLLTNAAGCDSTVTLDLTINNFDTGTDTQTACNSYLWIDGNTYTQSNNTATYLLTNAAGCDSTVTLDLTINTINNSVTQSGVTLSAIVAGASYQWLNCNNNSSIISGETNQNYTAITNGSYAVEITQDDCIDTSTCYSIISIGIIENNFGNDLLIYPNPTNGIFSIDLGRNYQTVTITITDLNGKLIQSKTYNESKLLNLKLEKPVGVYLLIIESGDKKTIIRLIKE